MLFALATGLAASLLATPVLRWVSRRTERVAHPRSDRWSTRVVALDGGVAIVVATVLGWVVASHFGGDVFDIKTTDMLLPAVAMGFVGWIDDRINLRPAVKFTAQVIAGGYLASTGALLSLTPIAGINAVLTVFWFVAITNAINLLDNMDGIAAGVTAIAAIFLGLALSINGAYGAAVLAWALAGSCLGFLRYNFAPASIFMGDAGSLFLGATLAALVTASPIVTSSSLVSALFVPIAIVGVPIADTTLVTITRLLSGRRVSQGGRDHTTHRLVALGLSERQTALLLYTFSTLGGLIAIWVTSIQTSSGFLLGALFLVVLVLLAAYLGRMHVEHTTANLGHESVTLLASKLLFKKRLAEMLLDVVIITMAYFAAFYIRFDGDIPADYLVAFQTSLGAVIAVQIATFSLVGCYRSAWRYTSLHEAMRVGVGALIVVAAIWSLAPLWLPPLGSRSLGAIYGLTLLTLAVGCRVSFRALDLVHLKAKPRGEPVVVYGAGDAGVFAIRELRNNALLAMNPVCFLDDDWQKHTMRILGIEVVGGIEEIDSALERFRARKVLIATRKITTEVRNVLDDLARTGRIELLDLSISLNPLRAPASVRRISGARERITAWQEGPGSRIG